MRASIVDLLVDPVSRKPLTLAAGEAGSDGDLRAGELRGADGSRYPIVDGIPRFVLTDDAGQRQTESSFAYKWARTSSYDSPAFRERAIAWRLQRYGFASEEDMGAYLGRRRRVLDAGCGSGFGASLWLDALEGEWFGADISEAIDVAGRRLGGNPKLHFLQADMLQLPFRDGTFDLIIAEGTMHHTPSTERAFQALTPLLAAGGEMVIYVYRKKGPLREFTDDYIRQVIADIPPGEAWELLKPLTRLGEALAKLKVEVEVPEDIPYLGIKAGRYDVHRLLYYHFAKMFWHDRQSFDENHHINFDWYHPRYAHRHTEEEVRRWFDEAGLSITHIFVEEAGISVRAAKP
jgi:arsenite methyltransferase